MFANGPWPVWIARKISDAVRNAKASQVTSVP